MGIGICSFTEIVGETPSQYRAHDHRDHEVVPACVSKVVTRPQRRAVNTTATV